MTTRTYSLSDHLSHLSFASACKLLGPLGKSLLTEGGRLELANEADLQITATEARVSWATGEIVKIVLDPSAALGLRLSCSECAAPCVHLGGLFSILLEEKSTIGLAMPPPDRVLVEDETTLFEQAMKERAERAKSERMTIDAANPMVPWTDYTVLSAISGKTYRVALRSEGRNKTTAPVQTFASIPLEPANTS
jgi:hypothetical protein